MADGELSNECGKYSHTSAVLVVVLYYLVCRNERNKHDACMEQDRVDVPVMVYRSDCNTFTCRNREIYWGVRAVHELNLFLFLENECLY